MSKIVFTTVVVLWMCAIFWFSAQPAEESTQMSLGVGYEVGKLFVPGFSQWSAKEQKAFAEKVDYPVRKCAHASEYMILCFLLYFAVSSYPVNRKKSMLLALLLTVFYAMTDEVHQLFVPGRSGRITDVAIDTAGALVSVVLLLSFHALRHKLKQAKQVRQSD